MWPFRSRKTPDPIFIVGNRRSGTTLLYNLLCSTTGVHPQLAEIQPLTQLLNALQWSADNYDRITRDFFASNAEFDKFSRSICRQFVDQAWVNCGRPRRLIVKNPELSFHLATLSRTFPAAKFIACTRDPRDQVASEVDVILRRDPAGRRPNVDGLVAQFHRYLDPILAELDQANASVRLVKYEELVARPEAVLKDLGEFCGLPISATKARAGWVDQTGLLDRMKQRPSFSPLYGSPVAAERVGSHAMRLPPDDLAQVERSAKSVMKRLDYLPANHLGPGDDASLEFVLIAESGELERQALLLCESLRLFAGKYSQCRVTVVSPRASRRPSPETLARLEEMGCAYLALEIDSVEPDYGTTFRMYVSAEMEKTSKADVLVVMDSDLLFAAEPDLSLNGAAAALRPVDVAGICSEGPNDPRDAYWRALCHSTGVDYHAIPMVETTVEKAVVKASYNGGLVVASRKHRIYERALDYFQQSVAAGLAPSPGTPATFEAGHGVVAGRGSELWGSSQACLSLAIWGSGLWVRELPGSHNFPLHVAHRMSRETQSQALSIIHYHSLLAGNPLHNPMLSGAVNVSRAFVEWLTAKTVAIATA